MVGTRLVAMMVTTLGIRAPVLSSAQDTSFVKFRVLKPELALQAAQGAMTECRKRGYQVAVSIVDRFGVLQVTLRDQLAGPHLELLCQRPERPLERFRRPRIARVPAVRQLRQDPFHQAADDCSTCSPISKQTTACSRLAVGSTTPSHSRPHERRRRRMPGAVAPHSCVRQRSH